jgi:hypothetical protein
LPGRAEGLVVSQDVVLELGGQDLRWSGPCGSCARGGQHEGEIIAQGRDRFHGHGARPLHRPFVVLLQHDGADQPGDRGLIRSSGAVIIPGWNGGWLRGSP